MAKLPSSSLWESPDFLPLFVPFCLHLIYLQRTSDYLSPTTRRVVRERLIDICLGVHVHFISCISLTYEPADNSKELQEIYETRPPSARTVMTSSK